MKIFYAVQATGNGHISRARQLMPYLQQYGEVDVFLSGANATLEASLPIRYRSQGLSLFYSACGGLDYRKMWRHNSYFRALREARDLPLERYDLILNDFDFITAKACAARGLSSVQFGHQASFMSPNTPRPHTRSLVGELILRQYAPATHYVGLHFQPYDNFIFPPVVKPFFLEAQPTDLGHITVYLPAYQQHCLEPHFRALPDLHFHWFLPGVKEEVRQGNITYLPISQEGFNQSLLHCHGLITGGGFETPAEALYLGKRLLSIPIRGQYEQRCNAAALEQLGIMVLEDADTPHFAGDIRLWLETPKPPYRQQPNNIEETLAHVVSLAGQPAATAVA
jgi:uncharacterized protein (TIGR00661 family)